MADQEQLEILKQGYMIWNEWREKNPDIEIDLSGAELSGADLRGSNLAKANFRGAKLSKVDFRGANLSEGDFREVDLFRANLDYTNLVGTNLSKANLNVAEVVRSDLTKANLSQAHLYSTNFYESTLNYADLRNCDLTHASLVLTKIIDAKISGSSVYGVNVWDLEGEFEEQRDLIISRGGDSVITVDNIKIAQFIYLILNNHEIQNAINILTSKSVLILGRFALPERKAILDTLRDKLRDYNLLPIVFDFDRPTDKDFTETIKTLAGLSYFVIADVTNPKSSPLELQATVPDYQIPFVPIIQEGESPFAMMVDLQKKYSWVLKTVTYDSLETLIKVLKPLIIDPAMKKRQELRLIKAQEPEVISGRDFLEKGKA